jgi:hypothetical protein
MPSTIAQKLKIKESDTILTLNAPADFKKVLGPVPKGATITEKASGYQQVHWFVLSKAQMEKELGKVLKLVTDGILCWIYYPKGTSKIQTDLTRDKGWEALLKHKDLQWINLISFNDTWSAFAFRRKTDSDKKKDATPKKREIFDYIDAEKKTVRLPDDLAAALKKNKKADTFYQSLSFSNKKEYVEWIILAKREETRTERVNGTIERLLKQWKNPRNI